MIKSIPINSKVRILVDKDKPSNVGKIGILHQIDYGDGEYTYEVSIWGGGRVRWWVSDVELIENIEEVISKTELTDWLQEEVNKSYQTGLLSAAEWVDKMNERFNLASKKVELTFVIEESNESMIDQISRLISLGKFEEKTL